MTVIYQTPDDEPWESAARSVFWSRAVPLQKWRAGVLAGHRSYLPDSIRYMSSRNFVRFLGRETFVDQWPRIRQHVPRELAPEAAPLDALWSWHKSGTFKLRPESALAQWPGRRREMFNQVVQEPGISIYRAAKQADMPYRRAYDHAQAMIEQGLLRARPGNGPRKETRLYSF
jgi:hypothetical protein